MQKLNPPNAVLSHDSKTVSRDSLLRISVWIMSVTIEKSDKSVDASGPTLYNAIIIFDLKGYITMQINNYNNPSCYLCIKLFDIGSDNKQKEFQLETVSCHGVNRLG